MSKQRTYARPRLASRQLPALPGLPLLVADHSNDKVIDLRPNTKYGVSVIKDNVLDYPELWMDVYIAGDKFEERIFAEMLVRARCARAATPEEADIVIFTGGADVSPELYDEKPHRSTHTNVARDRADIAIYERCLKGGIPMVGVCRGAQLLWVLQGGKLYQDVDHHNGDHPIFDFRKQRHIPRVSSVHHQAVIQNKLVGEVLATASKSTERWLDNYNVEKGKGRDVEAYFCEDTVIFGVQGHPEYRGYNLFACWFLETCQDLIVSNPNISLQKFEGGISVRRLDPVITQMNCEKFLPTLEVFRSRLDKKETV